MQSKGRTHVTLHEQGKDNKPTELMVPVASIEYARPVTAYISYVPEKVPAEFVTSVSIKGWGHPHLITETVEELQQKLDAASIAEVKQLTKIERVLTEILGELKRS